MRQIFYDRENKTLLIITDMIFDFYQGEEAVKKYAELVKE